MNAGTSMRSACTAGGNTDHPSVREANKMGSRNLVRLMVSSWTKLRTVLLMMLAVALNATIILEQPSSSFFVFYDRFRDFMRVLAETGGPGTAPCLTAGCPVDFRRLLWLA